MTAKKISVFSADELMRKYDEGYDVKSTPFVRTAEGYHVFGRIISPRNTKDEIEFYSCMKRNEFERFASFIEAHTMIREES